jgi:hypothetical protein
MARALQPRPQPTYLPPDTLKGQPWWLQPVLVVVVLGGFSVYAIWAAAQPPALVEPYLSPFDSPMVHALGPIPGAYFVLLFPLLFRATCYYYRKAYYRSFFWDPPACARPEPRPSRRYTGERGFPFVLSNLHRFFLYFAIIILIILWIDAIRAFDFGGHFGIGLGTLIMVFNVLSLSLYTFSCHSLRHLVGGNVACFSCVAAGQSRHTMWRWISALNPRHPQYAWISLFSVLATDIYIRLLMAGAFHDPRWVS